MIPGPVEIDRKDWDALMKASADMMSLQQMMDMFIHNCRSRMSKIQGETRELWGQLADKHKLDLTRVSYEPDPSKPRLIPVGVNLRTGALSGPGAGVS